MADTYYVQTELAPIACFEQLQPQPALLGEYEVLRTVGGATLTTLGPGLLGFPNNGPYVVGCANFALFNGIGSGKLVNVQSITITETQGRTASATTNRLGVQRITGLAGGDDVTPVALDTNNAAIPAAVLIREYVGSVTTTGTVLRTILDLPQLNPTRAVAFPSWRLPGTADRVYGVGTVDALQGQVLREGEGLAIFTSGNVAKENFPLAVVVTIRIGAENYWIRTRLATSSMGAMLAIFNGAGSGVVVEVLNVAASEIATDEQGFLRRFQLETISGVTPNSAGDRIDPVPMDSANAALPSQILCAEKAGCLQHNGDGVNLDNSPHRHDDNVLRRLVSAPFGVSAGLSCAVPVGQRMQRQFIMSEDRPFVLRENEGIALFQRQLGSGQGWGYQLQCRFSVEDVPGQAIAPVVGSTIVRAIA